MIPTAQHGMIPAADHGTSPAAANLMVKGWCPGALRPMESGDGLIVRLRISGGIVGLGLAEQVADWSRRWGNGQIDLTNRANLQLRGLCARHLPDLHDALEKRDLLDGTESGEAVRNVISSPLAGIDPDAALDVRPIAKRLEQRLASDTTLHALPGKFGFAIDDGGRLGLGDGAADVRFVAVRQGAQGAGGEAEADRPVFEIRFAGGPECFGPCGADALCNVAAAIGHAFLRLRSGREASIRRMRDVVAQHGAGAIAREAGLAPVCSAMADRHVHPSSFLGPHPLGTAAFVGIGLPFGRITADDLSEIARKAAGSGAEALRLTPWRAMLIPVPSVSAARTLLAGMPPDRLILDPADPRRDVAACPGSPACVRATTPVRRDAAVLAAELAQQAGSATLVHVSGCEKGCAHPRPAPLTFVARNGRYDLVRDGTASDPPSLCNLTLAQAAAQTRLIVATPAAGRTA